MLGHCLSLQFDVAVLQKIKRVLCLSASCACSSDFCGRVRQACKSSLAQDLTQEAPLQPSTAHQHDGVFKRKLRFSARTNLSFHTTVNSCESRGIDMADTIIKRKPSQQHQHRAISYMILVRPCCEALQSKPSPETLSPTMTPVSL